MEKRAMNETMARQIDEYLRARGFVRDYLEGGPIEEPPFSWTDRGLRLYLNADAETYVFVTTRGTWHIKQFGSERPRARGVGVAHLVRPLRAILAENNLSG